MTPSPSPKRRVATIVQSERGRGRQLIAGARAARGEWLLFLHADTVLAAGWEAEAAHFIDTAANIARAAAFRLRSTMQARRA